MSERPIIFSAPMVRAIRGGLKTQTRRIIKPQPSSEARDAGVIHSGNPESNGVWAWLDDPDLMWAGFTKDESFRCPYGVPGDRLWARETFANIALKGYPPTYFYRADSDKLPPKEDRAADNRWHPSIHMPRRASRITLTVTDVRVQRLQQISEADALAEGVRQVGARWEVDGIVTTPKSARDAFSALWDYIHGAVPWKESPGSWAANPWVFAVSFERVHDQGAAA